MNGWCLTAHLHNDLDASSFNLEFRQQTVNIQFIKASYSMNSPENFELIECSLKQLVIDVGNFFWWKGMQVVFFSFLNVFFDNIVVLS
jgi:hypothetical protein